MGINVREFASKVSDAIPLAMKHFNEQEYVLDPTFKLPQAPGSLDVPAGEHEVEGPIVYSRRVQMRGKEELGKTTKLRVHANPVVYDPTIHAPGDLAGTRSNCAILMSNEHISNSNDYPVLRNLAIVNADPVNHPEMEGIVCCGGAYGRLEHLTLVNFKRHLVFDGSLNMRSQDIHFAYTSAADDWADEDLIHVYIAAPADRENGFLEGHSVMDQSIPNNLSFSHLNHNARGVAYRIDSGVNHTIQNAHFGTGVYRIAEFRGRCHGVHFDLGNYTERIQLAGASEYFLIRHKEDAPTLPQYPAKRLTIRTGWNSMGDPSPVPAFIRVGDKAHAEQVLVEGCGFIGGADGTDPVTGDIIGGQIQTEGDGSIIDLWTRGVSSESCPVVHPDANVTGQVFHQVREKHSDGTVDPRTGLGTAHPQMALDVKHPPDSAGHRFYYDPPAGTGRPPQEYRGVQVAPDRTSVREQTAMAVQHTHPNSVRGWVREARVVDMPQAVGAGEWHVVAEFEVGQKAHGLLTVTLELIRGSTTHLGTWVYKVPVAKWDAAQPMWGGIGTPDLVHHGEHGNDPNVSIDFEMVGWTFRVKVEGDIGADVNGTVAIEGFLGNG